jgi:hypothetical protein
MRMRVVVLRNFGLNCCQRALGILLLCFVRYDDDRLMKLCFMGKICLKIWRR